MWNSDWLLLPAGSFNIEATTVPSDFQVLETNIRIRGVKQSAGETVIAYAANAGGTVILKGDVEVSGAQQVTKSADGLIRIDVPRGNGELRVSSAKPLAAPLEPSNSVQPLLRP